MVCSCLRHIVEEVVTDRIVYKELLCRVFDVHRLALDDVEQTKFLAST